MKKVISLIVCVALVLTLSVSAFAAEKVQSPQVKGMLRKGTGVQTILNIDTWYDMGGNVHAIVKANKEYGTFNSWTFFKEDGTKATKDVDFNFVTGDEKSEQVEFTTKVSIIVCGNYNNTPTDPLKPSSDTPEKKEEKSDKTGDIVIPVASVLLLAGAAFVFASKKVSSK